MCTAQNIHVITLVAAGRRRESPPGAQRRMLDSGTFAGGAGERKVAQARGGEVNPGEGSLLWHLHALKTAVEKLLIRGYVTASKTQIDETVRTIYVTDLKSSIHVWL